MLVEGYVLLRIWPGVEWGSEALAPQPAKLVPEEGPPKEGKAFIGG